MRTLNRILTISDPGFSIYCEGNHKLTACGVFSSGIYFEDAQGRVLMLYDQSYGCLPFGLAGTEINGNAKTLKILPGTEMILDNKRLISEDGSLFALISYCPYSPARPVLPAREGIRFLQSSGKAFLSATGRSSLAVYSGMDCASIKKNEVEDIFARTGYAGIQRLEYGLHSANASELSAGLDMVLGLGRGLTPSFDDFLTGLMSALNFCGREWGLEIPAKGIISALLQEKATKKTNKYSAAYLLASATGGRFSAVEDVLALAGGKSWSAAAEKLTLIGGSSGADMLAGVVFTARVINNMPV